MRNWLFLIFFVVSCSHVNTLNLEEHEFGKKPARIVWLQIAGFTEEHVAMLRFGMSEEAKRTSFEKMSCTGKMWTYNLVGLRPTPEQGFRSQMLGTANIKSTCLDFNRAPIWDHLQKLGYQTAIIENFSKNSKSDLVDYFNCKNEKKKKVTLWKMAKSKTGPFFHHKESKKFQKGTVYFDKSCQKSECHSSLYSNVQSIEKEFVSNSSKSLLIIRDFSFYEALIVGDILHANEVLLELEKLLGYLQESNKNNEDALLLVTSSSVRDIEFPKKGEGWSRLVREGKGIIFKNNSLMSTVLARGASAENFCGIFRESEILPRLFWMTNRSFIKQMFTDLL